MIVIRQKEFNSKAQKERRAKWDIANTKGKRPSDGLVEDIKISRGDIPDPDFPDWPKKNAPKTKMTEKEALDAAKKHIGRKGGVRKLSVKEGLVRSFDVLEGNNNKPQNLRKLDHTVNKGKVFEDSKPNTELFKKEAIEDVYKGVRDLPGASEKKKSLIKRANEYEKTKAQSEIKKAIKDSYRPIYFHENGEISKPNKFDEKSLKDLGDSIAKHRAKAAELRAKKVAGQKLVKNLKTAGKVGIGVAGAAGIGYGIKKAVDKNKKENGKEK